MQTALKLLTRRKLSSSCWQRREEMMLRGTQNRKPIITHFALSSFVRIEREARINISCLYFLPRAKEKTCFSSSCEGRFLTWGFPYHRAHDNKFFFCVCSFLSPIPIRVTPNESPNFPNLSFPCVWIIPSHTPLSDCWCYRWYNFSTGAWMSEYIFRGQ